MTPTPTAMAPMELLGTDGITRAAAGPSEECHIYGHEFSVPSREDPFYDDRLTPDELSLIAGVYIVPNREASAGEDDIHLSWWPTATQWDKSSGNQGYWTPHNEIWFQRRLDAIRSGDHRLLGSKH
ncbi:hypothetical protein C8Q76DRAFT_796340 [Earliella scabrosa]|nr:hypothetical protein C8Q76DRAFT_796340 [Earliella scabrosa]